MRSMPGGCRTSIPCAGASPTTPSGSATCPFRTRTSATCIARGDLARALANYKADLAIAERLAKQDPNNAEWQRDLSVAYETIGSVQHAQAISLARSRATTW